MSNTYILRSLQPSHESVTSTGLKDVIGFAPLLLFAFSIAGLLGNLFVCLAIQYDPRLQNATNCYLFSLAIVDMLVSVLVIPLAILNLITDEWLLGRFFCSLWLFSDVFLCTTSILLLCLISCDRYYGIKDPFNHRQKSKKRTKKIILATWLVSGAMSSPVLLLGWLDSENVLRSGQCNLYSRYFVAIGSIVMLLTPASVMVVMYYLTVKRLNQFLKNFKLNKSEQSTMLSEKKKSKVKCIFVVKEPKSKKASLKEPLSLPLQLKSDGNFKNIQPERATTPNPVQKRNNFKSKAFKMAATKVIMENRTIEAFRSNRESSAVRNEQKAVKVLGIVFVIFVVAWVPFAVLNIVSAVCVHCIPSQLITMLVWPGYISSVINPMIYNAFNKKFRSAFAHILKCRCIELRRSRPPHVTTKRSNRMCGIPKDC